VNDSYATQWYAEAPFLQEWWNGWQIVKHPNDLMMYQEIIWQTQPELIVETGTYAGGSALFMANILDAMGPKHSQVVSVDIAVAPELPDHPRITFLQGQSSTDLRVVEAIQNIEMEIGWDCKTMVVLDSDHRQEHVLKELKLYAPLVSKGAYLIVEDTHPLSVYSGDEDRSDGYPAGALKQWNPGKHGFEADPRRERFLFTQNPQGYLRRK
jgi:cephalosporin hydroxylase